MQISQALKGYGFAPKRWSWGPDEVILYALGVGATPPRDLGLVYEGPPDGSGPTVLPTFATVSTGRAFLPMVEELEIPLEAILHGDQRLTLHQPLPASATVTVERWVEAVWDKGADAVLVVGERVQAEEVLGVPTGGERVPGERLLWESQSSWFVRAGGGFGGARGPSSSGVLPDPVRPPDVVRRVTVAPGQTALFRLSGDRNPIHIDPAFARAAGFDGAFIHGLCTFGMVGLELLMELCAGETDQLRGLEARFIAPVRPGDELEIQLWREGPELVCLQARVDGRPVLAGARALTRR